MKSVRKISMALPLRKGMASLAVMESNAKRKQTNSFNPLPLKREKMFFKECIIYLHLLPLKLIDFLIEGTGLKQGFMGSFRHDFALVQDNNPIATSEAIDTLGNE